MIALWAALAMVVQDILSVLMVQCENRKRGWAAGCLDAIAWLCGLITMRYALSSVNGHNTGLKVLVVLAVTAANIIGSKLGQWSGDRFFPDRTKEFLEERLTRIELKLSLLQDSPGDS